MHRVFVCVFVLIANEPSPRLKAPGQSRMQTTSGHETVSKKTLSQKNDFSNHATPNGRDVLGVTSPRLKALGQSRIQTTSGHETFSKIVLPPKKRFFEPCHPKWQRRFGGDLSSF